MCLAAIFIFQKALSYFSVIPDENKNYLSKEAITTIVVTDGKGDTFQIIKKKDSWLVEGLFPVNQDQMSMIWTFCDQLHRKKLVSSNPKKYSLYGLDHSGLTLTFMNNHKKILKLLIGKSSHEFLEVYFRFKDQDDASVYRLTGLFREMLFEGMPSWKDRTILSLEELDVIDSMFVVFDSSEPVLLHRKNGRWIQNGVIKFLSMQGMEVYLRRFLAKDLWSISMLKELYPDLLKKKPSIVWTIDYKKEADFVMTFFEISEKGAIVVLSNRKEYVYFLDKEDYLIVKSVLKNGIRVNQIKQPVRKAS